MVNEAQPPSPQSVTHFGVSTGTKKNKPTTTKKTQQITNVVFLNEYITCLSYACMHVYIRRNVQKHVYQYITKPIYFKYVILLGHASSLNCFR